MLLHTQSVMIINIGEKIFCQQRAGGKVSKISHGESFQLCSSIFICTYHIGHEVLWNVVSRGYS